jgi:hypothetical protein
MKHTFTATSPQDVYVEIGSGEVQVLATDTDQVVVDIEGRDAEHVVVDQDGDEVRVVARARTGFLSGFQGLKVHVLTPRGSNLATRLGSAGVTVEGPLEHVRIQTGSGQVVLDEVGQDALVKTGSGEVAVRSVGGESEIKTGSGDIGVGHLGGAARLSTGSGDIEVGRADAPISFKTGSGDIVVRDAHGGQAQLSAGSGQLEVTRMSSGIAQLKNASGDIKIGVPAGTPVWTDISSVSGHVRSSIPATGAPRDGQDHVEVTARTVSGDVYLESV